MEGDSEEERHNKCYKQTYKKYLASDKHYKLTIEEWYGRELLGVILIGIRKGLFEEIFQLWLELQEATRWAKIGGKYVPF